MTRTRGSEPPRHWGLGLQHEQSIVLAEMQAIHNHDLQLKYSAAEWMQLNWDHKGTRCNPNTS